LCIRREFENSLYGLIWTHDSPGSVRHRTPTSPCKIPPRSYTCATPRNYEA
jgi:hypothetical protein